jgi:hypothetical protein
MKDFYYTHKRLVVIGGVAVVFVVLVALFVAGALIGSGRGDIGYAGNISGGFVGKSVSQTRGISADSLQVEKSSIFPPEPTVPASGIVDLSVDRKIIKNASVDMVVKNAENTIDKIKDITKANKGFVGNASVWETGGEKHGNISLRIPSDVFNVVLSSVKDLAVKVTREDVSTQDVTEQFIDLQAQLKNYKAEEAQYLKVLNRAYTVEDILKVRKELNRVRGNIERMQGRINYLSRQISMSTISVSLTSEADVKVLGIVWSPWLEIKAGVRDMLAGLIAFVNSLIAFVFKLPLLILWITAIAALVWAVWKGFVIIRKRLF